MTALVLYTTSHCHLCEKAQAFIMELAAQYSINYDWKEISDDDMLIAKYGIRIPVIQRRDNQSELDWPFTKQDIVMFLDIRPRHDQ